jgi:hypothetical protein
MTIGLRDAVKKDLASSGKSPAYRHHRNNRARAGKLVAGFLYRRPHFKTPHPPMQRIDARRVLIELPSEPLKLSMISAQTRGAVLTENHLRIMFDLAGTRERAGTRRGQGHARPRPREG